MRTLLFNQSPSVVAYMLRALYPSPGFAHVVEVPALTIRQRDFVFQERACRELSRLCGLEPTRQLPLFFPQVLGFRLVMRAVTDPQFPAPIWNALQVRNHLVQLAPLEVGSQVDLELKTVANRHLEKGVEVDFLMTARHEGAPLWTSQTTFYYRGQSRDGKGDPKRPPALRREECRPLSLPRGGQFSYGHLSGDYNGIHLSDFYARLLGFRSAFLHPHRALGALWSLLPKAHQNSPQELEVWFRGPVPYGSSAEMVYDRDDSQVNFGLFVEDDRPCLVGSLR